MGDDRERIIAHALWLWSDRSIGDDRGIIGFVNDNLDMAGLPRVRAEERAVIVREIALQARHVDAARGQAPWNPKASTQSPLGLWGLAALERGESGHVGRAAFNLARFLASGGRSKRHVRRHSGREARF